MRFAFLLLPWLELFTLIELGIKTSALAAMAYVLATILIGLAILQRQGRGMLERLNRARDGGMIGPELLLDDMAMGLSGLLFLFPGIITDVLALVVMVGPLRRRVARVIWGTQRNARAPERDAARHETIEGTFRRIDDEENS
jgi:UPF0716 protein FxsA